MDHILGVVIIAGVVYFLIQFFVFKNTAGDEAREKLKGKVFEELKSFLIFLACLIILYPAWYWIKNELTPTVNCQAASQYEKRSCLINRKWSAPLMQADEPGLAKKRLCVAPGAPEVKSQRFVNNAGAYWRFKAVSDDDVLITYKFMDACPPGEIP